MVQRPVGVQRRRETLLGAGGNQKGSLEEEAGFRAFVGESLSGRGARRAFRGGRRPEHRLEGIGGQRPGPAGRLPRSSWEQSLCF